MFELLDTGRIAHKFGKWRWTVYFAAALCVFLLGWALAELLMIPSLMSSTAADTSIAFWTFAAFSLISLILLVYSVWLCYIDEVRQAYRGAAEHYKVHGW